MPRWRGTVSGHHLIDQRRSETKSKMGRRANGACRTRSLGGAVFQNGKLKPKHLDTSAHCPKPKCLNIRDLVAIEGESRRNADIAKRNLMTPERGLDFLFDLSQYLQPPKLRTV